MAEKRNMQVLMDKDLQKQFKISLIENDIDAASLIRNFAQKFVANPKQTLQFLAK